MNNFKKVSKFTFLILVFVLLAGFSGILADRFVMPWLSSKESLARLSFFKKANEKVTIIREERTITVKEDFSVSKTTENVLPSVVSVITFEKNDPKEGFSANIKSNDDIKDSIKTGLIIAGDGLIVSVLDKTLADSLASSAKDSFAYKILLKDGREADAKLLAVDPYNLLAFYKIEMDNLPVPGFGNSDELLSGEKLVICGNATGNYQNTFSTGIIEKKDQFFTLLNSRLASSEKMQGAIIAEVEIGEENIGGPVVDFNGTVVGIANRIEKDGENVGFITPIREVEVTMDELIGGGTIERPFLGLYYLPINREVALLNNLSVNDGALVYSFSGQQGLAVLRSSPADKAGIKIGDIITQIDDQPVTAQNPLAQIISRAGKDEELTMKILRDGKEMEVKVVLE